jgi:hypothetical protein
MPQLVSPLERAGRRARGVFMAHYKRKRSKKQRSGLFAVQTMEDEWVLAKVSRMPNPFDHRRRQEADSELKQFQREPLRYDRLF